jgi:putative FmdB family regulatory protein
MIYEYSCKRGHRFERVLMVADYRTPQICECGADSRRIISLPRLVVTAPDVHYDSPIDGRPITSMAAHRDDLARNGCQLYDPEMRKDADRFRQRADKELDRKVDDTVDAMFEKMPTRKREQLENEVRGGADVDISRRSVK